MDKEILKQLTNGNGGNVVVLGDAVGNKYVDNEVTNVESGGVGVQVINCENYYGPTERATGNKKVKQKDELFSGQPCQGSTEHKLPEELDTPKAHIVWERAKSAGYVDENLQPVADLTQKEVAIVASVISDALDLKPKWMALSDFWGVTYLSKKYSEAFGKNSSSGDFEREVRKALSGEKKK